MHSTGNSAPLRSAPFPADDSRRSLNMKTIAIMLIMLLAGCRYPSVKHQNATDVAGLVREFAGKEAPTEADLTGLNESARKNREHLLRSLVSLGLSSTDYNEADVIVGLIAYFEFTIQELESAKTSSPATVAKFYDAIIRETENGDVAIRRQDVIRILQKNSEP
jgi:hypothetical protein